MKGAPLIQVLKGGSKSHMLAGGWVVAVGSVSHFLSAFLQQSPIFYVPVTAFSRRVNGGPLGFVAAEMVVDPETTPYLDIANQTGRSIRIPPSERKVSAV